MHFYLPVIILFAFFRVFKYLRPNSNLNRIEKLIVPIDFKYFLIAVKKLMRNFLLHIFES